MENDIIGTGVTPMTIPRHGGHAVGPEESDTGRKVIAIRGDHPSFPGCQILVTEEGEARDITEVAGHPLVQGGIVPTVIMGTYGVTSVFDERQTVPPADRRD